MPYTHIFVPVDANTPEGLELGGAALRHAVALGTKLGARVTVGAVYTPTLYIGGDTLAGGGRLISEVETEQRKRFDKRMDELLSTAGDCKKVTLELSDSVPEVIADAANEMGADLIVVPSHGRTGVSRFLLGSVAERLARIAQMPVLLLKKSKEDDGAVGATVPA